MNETPWLAFALDPGNLELWLHRQGGCCKLVKTARSATKQTQNVDWLLQRYPAWQTQQPITLGACTAANDCY
jgi:hypothetical protein